LILDAERIEPNRKRRGTHRPPSDSPRVEVLRDLPGEKAAGEEDAPVGGHDLGAHQAAGGGAAPSSDDVGSGAAGGRHVPVSGTKPGKALTAEELLEKIGLDFLDNYRQDSAKAWEDLMLAVMTNLGTLANSALVGPVRDLINIAKDVEDQIRKSREIGPKTLDGDRRLPMDAIGAQWRIELPSVASATVSPTLKKNSSRQSSASASRSTTSKGSASSSAKTSSETTGSDK